MGRLRDRRARELAGDVERELARLVAEGGVPGGTPPRLDLKQLEAHAPPAGRGAEAGPVAASVARAIYRKLGR